MSSSVLNIECKRLANFMKPLTKTDSTACDLFHRIGVNGSSRGWSKPLKDKKSKGKADSIRRFGYERRSPFIGGDESDRWVFAIMRCGIRANKADCIGLLLLTPEAMAAGGNRSIRGISATPAHPLARGGARRKLTDCTSPANQSVLVGSYAAVAHMLDEVAAVSGVKGVMLTFDNIVIGMEQFGQRIRPLMQRRARAPAA